MTFSPLPSYHCWKPRTGASWRRHEERGSDRPGAFQEHCPHCLWMWRVQAEMAVGWWPFCQSKVQLTPSFQLFLNYGCDHCLTQPPAGPVPSFCCCEALLGMLLVPVFTNLAFKGFQVSSLFLKPHSSLSSYTYSMYALTDHMHPVIAFAWAFISAVSFYGLSFFLSLPAETQSATDIFLVFFLHLDEGLATLVLKSGIQSSGGNLMNCFQNCIKIHRHTNVTYT